MSDAKPLPDDSVSIRIYVEREWNYIINQWRRGWHAESRVDELEAYLEHKRQIIFEKRELDDSEFDWPKDWRLAQSHHDHNVDLVRNQRKFYEDLRELWFEWSRDVNAHFSAVSIETLRSMVLINGAAIIASISVLSGQIANPPPIVMTVAKITTFTSVISIILVATGHAILFHRLSQVQGRVRSVLVGFQSHRRLRSIGRYVRRHADPVADFANILVYLSVFVFGLSAFLSSILLLAR